MFRAKINRLNKKEFRQAFVSAHLIQGLAYQIRALRNQRGWTQADLAKKLGLKGQSAVARIEDPGYGKLSIVTLIKLSNVFDVALSIKFQSFSKFLIEHEDLSQEALEVDSFEDDNFIKKLSCSNYDRQSMQGIPQNSRNLFSITSPYQLVVKTASEVKDDFIKNNFQSHYATYFENIKPTPNIPHTPSQPMPNMKITKTVQLSGI
ncbi:MAG: helix-turn-helix transcriptional regulator [Methylomonas sp.]|jgi:transcriptional regulator with XRE-family HTH domain